MSWLGVTGSHGCDLDSFVSMIGTLVKIRNAVWQIEQHFREDGQLLGPPEEGSDGQEVASNPVYA